MGTTAYENNLYIRKHIKYFFTGINKEETVLSNQDTTSNPVWGDKVGRLKKVKDRLKK